MKRIIAACISMIMIACVSIPAAADDPIGVYESWNSDLKEYTAQICNEYNVDYSLALGVIYNESRFQSGLTHVNSNGTIDYGLMQVNEVNFEYLNKALGIQSMTDLLDDRVGIRCGVELLAYHKRHTNDDSAALLRYQIGEGKYKQYLRNGRYTNKTHQQVLTYQRTFQNYIKESERQKTDSTEQRMLELINRWNRSTFICWCSSEAEHGTCNAGVEISKFSTSSINGGSRIKDYIL